MTEKPEISWEEFFWENLRAEHFRVRCEECRKGGCIQRGVANVRNVSES